MSQLVYNPTRPTIKAASIGELLRQGAAILLGEFRGYKVDRIDYTDPKTGKPAHFPKLEMNVEIGDGTAIPVEVRLPKGVEKEDVQGIGLSKGQSVLLRLSGLVPTKGRLSASVGSEDNSIMILE